MTNYIVWIVLGTIWRFSGPGVIAAGGKLEKPVNMTEEAWTTQLASAIE